MWSSYVKTFAFRDCFDEIANKGNVEAINRLINTEQIDNVKGCIIVTDILSVNTVVNHFEASKNLDDGSWDLCFYRNDKPIATVSLFDLKEVQLCFEIEEEIETGKIKIHYCQVKSFGEYQI
jgi:hypothetical protein